MNYIDFPIAFSSIVTFEKMNLINSNKHIIFRYLTCIIYGRMFLSNLMQKNMDSKA